MRGGTLGCVKISRGHIGYKPPIGTLSDKRRSAIVLIMQRLHEDDPVPAIAPPQLPSRRVARAMDSVASDEHRSTASALTSVRSIGTAFGAAIAGVVANIAGLGDATEPGPVGHAVTAVYMFCCIPFGLAALLMFRFVRITFGKPALAGERRDVSSASP